MKIVFMILVLVSAEGRSLHVYDWSTAYKTLDKCLAVAKTLEDKGTRVVCAPLQIDDSDKAD